MTRAEHIKQLQERIAELTELADHLTGINAQQDETITRYQRENDRLTKRVEKLESNNDHAQAHIARLEAQLTPQAKAERAFIL